MTLDRCTFATLLAGFVFPTAAANLLSNGGFEAPTVADNTFQQVTPDGWSWQGPSGLVFNGLVLDAQSGINWPTAQDGDQFVDIGNVATYSIRQTFALATAGMYALAWYENAHVNANSSPYSVSIADSSLATLFEVNLNSANGGVWEQQQFSLNLTPGSFTLAFTAMGVPQGYDTLLDNISIATVVPEPATLALLALGIPVVLGRTLCLRRKDAAYSRQAPPWALVTNDA